MTRQPTRSWLLAWAARMLTLNSLGVTGITGGAFVLSYEALYRLALSIGFPHELAWIFPVIIDGFIVMASDDAAHTATATGLRPWSRRFRLGYDWALVLAATSSSAWFQVMSAPPGLLSKVGHAMPPLALLLAWEMRIHRVAAPTAAASHAPVIDPQATWAPAVTTTRLDTTTGQGDTAPVLDGSPARDRLLEPARPSPDHLTSIRAPRAEHDPSPGPSPGPVPEDRWTPPVDERTPTADPDGAPASAAATGPGAPAHPEPDGRTARQRAWEVFARRRAEGGELSGPELQRALPEISDGYARALLREFRAQAPSAPHTDGHAPQGLDQDEVRP